MLNKELKGIICCLIISLVMFSVFGKAEASSRRVLEDQDVMEKMIINYREIDLNGNLFTVYINQKTKTITVRGEIEVYDKVDWNEVEKVKRFFKMENPGKYEFVYEFKFVYRS